MPSEPFLLGLTADSPPIERYEYEGLFPAVLIPRLNPAIPDGLIRVISSKVRDDER